MPIAPTAHVVRCPWARQELDVAYHDREWGVPLHGDRALFELLILEGAQAGLSWSTILAKRDGYRRAFADFDPERIARFSPRHVERALADPGIVRNRLKVAATVTNARAYLDLRESGTSLDALLWGFVDGRPVQNAWRDRTQVPARTDASDAMSRELARRGFKFVGSTICYALMQAAGLVNDHLLDCFRHREVRALSPAHRSRSQRRAT